MVENMAQTEDVSEILRKGKNANPAAFIKSLFFDEALCFVTNTSPRQSFLQPNR